MKYTTIDIFVRAGVSVVRDKDNASGAIVATMMYHLNLEHAVLSRTNVSVVYLTSSLCCWIADSNIPICLFRMIELKTYCTAISV